MRTTALDSSRTMPLYEPPRLYQLVAPAEPSTARLARHFISGVLVATEHPLLIDDARICVSDTVTNVVQHARVPDLTVEVDVQGLRVITSIRDHDPTRLPRHRWARSDEERGRGLALVQQLSVAYGMNLVWDGLDVIGKCVWFELREGGDPR
ncbi:ATP-binding protein [Streptomyces sp. NPDC002536]